MLMSQKKKKNELILLNKNVCALDKEKYFYRVIIYHIYTYMYLYIFSHSPAPPPEVMAWPRTSRSPISPITENHFGQGQYSSEFKTIEAQHWDLFHPSLALPMNALPW